MTGAHTQVAEVGFRPRSVLFDSHVWWRAQFSVARYRSGWGVYRVTDDPHDPARQTWALWIRTGVKTKREATHHARVAVSKMFEGRK